MSGRTLVDVAMTTQHTCEKNVRFAATPPHYKQIGPGTPVPARLRPVYDQKGTYKDPQVQQTVVRIH